MKKKMISLLAALGLVLTAAGCGGKEDLPLALLDVEQYVTLGDYNNLDVQVEPAEVSDDEVDYYLYTIYTSYLTEETGGITDRPVAVGDTVCLDYEGKKDGVAFFGGTAQNSSLTIGSGAFIDGFEDGLVGVMPGETVDLNLSFPDPYPNNPDLAGQPEVFTVTVRYIMPLYEEMNDETVAAIAPLAGMENVSTVEQMRQYVYDALFQMVQSNYEISLENAILDALIQSCTFEETLPEQLLEESRENISQNLDAFAQAYGMDRESFAAANYQMTADEVIETYAPNGVKQNLTLQAIANQEGLGVDDELLDSMLEEDAANAGYESVEEYMGEVSREGFRNYYMSQRVIDFLKGLYQGE